MGQEPEALRADIEARRENMSETIDAIGDRVSPSRIAQRRVDKAKSWAGNVKEKVMGSPQPPVSSFSSGSGNGSGNGAEHVKEAAQHAKEAVGNVPATVGRSTGGNPLVAGAIAFGIGAMLPPCFQRRKRNGPLSRRSNRRLILRRTPWRTPGTKRSTPSRRPHRVGLRT